MYAKMSTVEGTELYTSTTNGYFIWTGILYIQSSDLPFLRADADSRILLNAITLPNVPAHGDILNNTYKEWICVSRQFRPINALQAHIFCTFRWLGALQIRDHLSLEPITTVINPGTKKPIYNTWTDPNPAPGIPARVVTTKLCHFPLYRVIRNITYTKTVQFEARESVLQAKKCVNDAEWMGLDAGYWMVSDIDGNTPDGGVTYTYSVTFSTRDEISWTELDILERDGYEVYVDPVKFAQLVNLPYVAFSQRNTLTPGGTPIPGVVRADLYDTVNFPMIFGIGPGPSSKVDLSGIM